MRLIALFLLGMMGIANAQTQTQTFTSYVNSLNSASTINNSDQLWISQGGVGKRLPGSVLLAAVTGVASVSGTSGQVVCSPTTGAVICGLASPLNVIGGTLAAGTSALNVTATQPASPVAQQNAVSLTITGAGSASQTNNAMVITYSAGYTGSSTTRGLNVVNSNVGTAGSLSATATTGNKGIATGATGIGGAGWNIGLSGIASSAPVNIATSGIAGTAINSGTNIGGLFSASNTGSSPVFIGEYITLGGTTIPATSAGLIVDNVATAVPIALFQANGISQVEIQASGGVTMPSTVTGGDEGAGTINVSGGYYVNGSPITTLAHGGTNAALTPSNGGIVYSGASALAILSGTVTAGQCLLSGSSAAPTWGSCSGAAAVSSVNDSGGGTLTVSPATGAVLASIALGHANTWSAAQTDSVSFISPIFAGGAATGSTLALTSTTNGSPSGDSITMTTGGSVRATVLSGGNIGLGTEINPQFSFVQSANTTTGISSSGITANAALIGADAGNYSEAILSFGGTTSVSFNRADGTAASTTATTAADIIGGLLFGGYYTSGGPSWSVGKARVIGVAVDTFTSAAQGTALEFDTTPASSTTRAQAGRFMAGFIVGTGTSDPGAGNLLMSGNVTGGGWQGSVIGATYGGTGVNNGSNTLTVSSHSGTLAFGNASKTLTINNSIALTGTDSTVMTFPGTSSTVLTTGNSATTTVGYLFTSYSAGTVSSGTFTPAAANANYQYLTNNGAFTLAVPAADSAMDILVTNGASAGAITFSGYTVGSNTGDAYVTTNTDQFILSIRRINGVSTYVWKALQ